MNKLIRIGKGQWGSVFARIKLSDDGLLSIVGVEGPHSNGNALGGCGQLAHEAFNVSEFAPGWSAELADKFRAVWNEWHLNDMQAGSPAQTAYLKANPITDRLNYFQAACAALRAAGLQPDPGHLRNGKPYSYGSAWLRVDVPADVVAFLEFLPAADITPAWV